MKIDRFKSEPSGLGIKKLINQYKGRKGALIDLLQDIQAEENWLPEDALRQINRELGLPLSSIYGVATFYKAFSLKPRGKHLITVCQGTACHVRGAPHIVDDLQNILGIAPGETTPDKLFTLETVNCLGACALGPVVVVDGTCHGQMTKSRSHLLIEDIRTNTKRGKKAHVQGKKSRQAR